MDRYLYSGDSIVGIVPPTEYELELEQRIEKLEQLCNDLFNHVCAEQIGARVNMVQFVELSERMSELGLLEDCHD